MTQSIRVFFGVQAANSDLSPCYRQYSFTMSDVIRDSVFGQLVRLATGGKVFQYPDEADPAIRERYINKQKSGNLALHGTLQPPQEADEKEYEAAPSLSSSTSTASTGGVDKEGEAPPERVVSNIPSQISRLHSAESRPQALRRNTSHANSFLNELEHSTSRVSRVNTASGRPVDPEKGRDIHLVDWYGPDDSEVR